MVPTYKDGDLARNHRNKNIIASGLGLATRAEDIQVLMRERLTVAWKQFEHPTSPLPETSIQRPLMNSFQFHTPV